MKVLLAITFTLSAFSISYAQCPSPIPESMTRPQLRECITELHTTMNFLKQRIDVLERAENKDKLVPSGAVVAMNIGSNEFKGDDKREGCPAGWIRFKEAEGKFIAGADARTQSDAKHYGFFQQGGSKDVLLTPQHFPRHQHKSPVPNLASHDGYTAARFPYGRSGDRPENHNDIGSFSIRSGPGAGEFPLTGAVGELPGEKLLTIDTVPPFIALYYCKKQ